MNNNYYHYSGCGLDHVWLTNGYQIHNHPLYGPSVSIQDLDGLHRAIGLALVNKLAPLSGAELRYLRIEMDLSQRALGEFLGRQAQTVALWEKGQKPPEGVDYLVRYIYRQHLGDKTTYVEEVQRLRELDQQDYRDGFRFAEGEQGWDVA